MVEQKKGQPEQAVFILQTSEEMKQTYEFNLKALGIEASWYLDYEGICKAYEESHPKVLVIDTDSLPVALEEKWEEIRSQFSKSEIIALSSSDSSQGALNCMKAGFADFLLKPASPEELSYSLKKVLQKSEFLNQVEDEVTAAISVVSHIANLVTPTLVRFYFLQFVKKVTKAQGAAWVRVGAQGAVEKVYFTTRQGKKVPAGSLQRMGSKSKVILYSKKSDRRQWLIRCNQNLNEWIVIWGIPQTIHKNLTRLVLKVLEQSEITLYNILRYEEVKKQTFIDDLTGLYNSRYLKFALSNAILKCKKPDQAFSVLFIDVDHFKKINDSHSHLFGSEFLVTIGKTIKNAVRRIDPVFRYGGDEFVVILNDADTEGAKVIAERIRKNIERRVFTVQSKKMQTTVSIGIATYPVHAKDKETLLKMADEAMYSAKKGSRNAVCMVYELTEDLAKRKVAS